MNPTPTQPTHTIDDILAELSVLEKETAQIDAEVTALSNEVAALSAQLPQLEESANAIAQTDAQIDAVMEGADGDEIRKMVDDVNAEDERLVEMVRQQERAKVRFVPQK